MQIKKYIIVYSDRLSSLVDEVNKYIIDGYVPIGGVSFDKNDRYIQSMVKYA